MNFCKQFEEKIFEYAEGSLPKDLRKEVDEHFKSCQNCSDQFTSLRNLKTLLANLRPIKTSGDFETVLRARIRMERSLSRRSLFERPIGIPIYAATGALVVLAAFLFLSPLSKSFLNANSTNSAIPASKSFSDPSLSDMSTLSVGTSRQPQVHFPLDWVTGKGTRISSTELQKHTTDDSLKNKPVREVRHTYEF